MFEGCFDTTDKTKLQQTAKKAAPLIIVLAAFLVGGVRFIPRPNRRITAKKREPDKAPPPQQHNKQKPWETQQAQHPPPLTTPAIPLRTLYPHTTRPRRQHNIFCFPTKSASSYPPCIFDQTSPYEYSIPLALKASVTQRPEDESEYD